MAHPDPDATGGGRLDGMTLFRFAHMLRRPSAGGVERYLGELNDRLLRRNRMRIVQLHLVSPQDPLEIIDEPVGRGLLTWVPSVSAELPESAMALPRKMAGVLRRLLKRPLVHHRFLLSHLPTLAPTVAAFHWLSDDSRIVVRSLAAQCVPYIVVNHFENSRLRDPRFTDVIDGAAAVCGVSGVSVPAGLADRFLNISDGIDTQFFRRINAQPVSRDMPGPVVLLPSRITEGKGHFDAIEAMARLAQSHPGATLALAGRVEDQTLLRRLLAAAADRGLAQRVLVLGELSAEDLRDWYAVSDVSLLTTSSEGLGRVLLEAQAMETPVVAYDVGGVREAVAHGNGGYLVARGDVTALAERIGELIANKEHRAKIGEQGRRNISEKFCLDALAVRHERLYDSVLHQ